MFQYEIPCRWEFLLRIDNCACTSIRYTSIYRKLRHTNSLGFDKYEFISFFQAVCKMPERTTIVGNDFKASFDHCDNSFCSEKHIEYAASMPQLKLLLEKSPSCTQSIKFDCYQAKLMVSYFFLNVLALNTIVRTGKNHINQILH